MINLRRIGSQRAMQIAILGLLLTCFAQATYWIVDQVVYTRGVRDARLADWEQDARAAEGLLAAGTTTEEVRALFPHLSVGADGAVAIDAAHRDLLLESRGRRLNRYGWEGAFFLAVLLFGMGILVQTIRQRSELARRQQNFVAAVSHEFKSPLASLRLSAETVSLRKPQGEALERIAGRMTEDVDRLTYMVTNILEAARIEEGRVVQHPERVPLAPTVKEIVDHHHCAAHLKRVHVESTVPEGLEVWADPAAVRTVVGNLVDNAVKAVAANGGGSVRVAAGAEGRLLRIDVTDDGAGFPQGEAARLFEKFYRPGDELRRKTRGSGLGLYVVRAFVEQAGGRVTAESAGPGRGASFHVWLPAAPAEEVAA